MKKSKTTIILGWSVVVLIVGAYYAIILPMAISVIKDYYIEMRAGVLPTFFIMIIDLATIVGVTQLCTFIVERIVLAIVSDETREKLKSK